MDWSAHDHEDQHLTGETQIQSSDIVYDGGIPLSPDVDIGQVEGVFVMVSSLRTCFYAILFLFCVHNLLYTAIEKSSLFWVRSFEPIVLNI